MTCVHGLSWDAKKKLIKKYITGTWDFSRSYFFHSFYFGTLFVGFARVWFKGTNKNGMNQKKKSNKKYADMLEFLILYKFIDFNAEYRYTFLYFYYFISFTLLNIFYTVLYSRVQQIYALILYFSKIIKNLNKILNAHHS